jgi:hypothetical protein
MDIKAGVPAYRVLTLLFSSGATGAWMYSVSNARLFYRVRALLGLWLIPGTPH